METPDVSPDDTRVDSPDTLFFGFLRVMGVVLVIFGLAVMFGLCPLLDPAAIGLPNSRSFLAEGAMMLASQRNDSPQFSLVMQIRIGQQKWSWLLPDS